MAEIQLLLESLFQKVEYYLSPYFSQTLFHFLFSPTISPENYEDWLVHPSGGQHIPIGLLPINQFIPSWGKLFFQDGKTGKGGVESLLQQSPLPKLWYDAISKSHKLWIEEILFDSSSNSFIPPLSQLLAKVKSYKRKPSSTPCHLLILLSLPQSIHAKESVIKKKRRKGGEIDVLIGMLLGRLLASLRVFWLFGLSTSAIKKVITISILILTPVNRPLGLIHQWLKPWCGAGFLVRLFDPSHSFSQDLVTPAPWGEMIQRQFASIPPLPSFSASSSPYPMFHWVIQQPHHMMWWVYIYEVLMTFPVLVDEIILFMWLKAWLVRRELSDVLWAIHRVLFQYNHFFLSFSHHDQKLIDPAQRTRLLLRRLRQLAHRLVRYGKKEKRRDVLLRQSSTRVRVAQYVMAWYVDIISHHVITPPSDIHFSDFVSEEKGGNHEFFQQQSQLSIEEFEDEIAQWKRLIERAQWIHFNHTPFFPNDNISSSHPLTPVQRSSLSLSPTSLKSSPLVYRAPLIRRDGENTTFLSQVVVNETPSPVKKESHQLKEWSAIEGGEGGLMSSICLHEEFTVELWQWILSPTESVSKSCSSSELENQDINWSWPLKSWEGKPISLYHSNIPWSVKILYLLAAHRISTSSQSHMEDGNWVSFSCLLKWMQEGISLQMRNEFSTKGEGFLLAILVELETSCLVRINYAKQLIQGVLPYDNL